MLRSGMLGFEKEYATGRTKCTDEAVWERYRATLEMSMLHDITKIIVSTHQDLMSVANSIVNNLAHLKPAVDEDKMIGGLY